MIDWNTILRLNQIVQYPIEWTYKSGAVVVITENGTIFAVSIPLLLFYMLLSLLIYLYYNSTYKFLFGSEPDCAANCKIVLHSSYPEEFMI